MHLLEKGIFSLYHDIVRPTKVMNRAGIFRKESMYFKNQYSSQKKRERFRWFLMLNSDFKSTNFAIFEEAVHNIGRSDDMI